MLWVGLHLPLLSLESFAATLVPPQLGQPVALLQMHRVVAVDAAAAALGVQPSMKRATAMALAPTLVLGQADPLRDAQALQAVAHAALAFTPAVALDAQTTETGYGVRLEVQASLRYFGGLAHLVERLLQALQPLGHHVRWATAPTALGASLLARWRADQGPGPANHDALRVLLDDAPLHLLQAGHEHAQSLQGMGLRTLGDLRRLPRAGLARRFGPGLLLQLDRARGDAPDPHDWEELPEHFDSRLELFARADTSEQLLAGARMLLARLVAWTQGRQGRVGRFELLMHHEPRHRQGADQPACTALPVALAEPSADAAHLYLLLAERLGRLPLPAPALELSLRCDEALPGDAPNGELFASRSGERLGLVRLLERLQARLGNDQVRCLSLVCDHRPERAAQSRPTQVLQPTLPSPVAAPTVLARPVWLLPEPLALPEKAHQPWLDGQVLLLVAGPERIETGWWDGALAARDYFIAQAADGALVWIYRARLPLQAAGGEGWFLQGRFA